MKIIEIFGREDSILVSTCSEESEKEVQLISEEEKHNEVEYISEKPMKEISWDFLNPRLIVQKNQTLKNSDIS
jgi:hypothetical protein